MPRIKALTHAPSPRMAECQLTFIDRSPIDVAKASDQHATYRSKLEAMGCETVCWSFNQEYPDCAFIEDLAVCLKQTAVICSPQPNSRRKEVARLEDALSGLRDTRSVKPPATLEGGDVLQIGNRLLIGQSQRTSPEGISALSKHAREWGYEVDIVPVHGCLHLKTGCCAVSQDTLLLNPDWVDSSGLSAWRLVQVPSAEPFGSNLIQLGRQVLLSTAHPRTAEVLAQRDLQVTTVDISEFEKAEAGVTCLSLLLEEQ